MALLDIRQRAGYLFLAVILGHIILISAQVNSRSGVPFLEAFTFGAFAAVEKVLTTGIAGVRHVWTGYIGLRSVNRENKSLKHTLDQAQVELQQERALAEQSRRLEQLLQLRDQSKLTTRAAEVIGAGATPEFRTITIDRGRRDGLRTDMAVIAPAGVVGRVVVATALAAKVQLLIDRNAAAGAIIERSRAQGVVVGGGDEYLRMDYVSEVSDIVTGDAVVTSGIDGIYPKGFVIGHVESVEKSGGAFKKIIVRPAVNFRALEEVLVVVTPTGPADAPDGSGE